MPVYHVHRRQLIRLRPYTSDGKLRPLALRRFSRFMRCHHTDIQKKIHWRLLVVLYQGWLWFGQPQVTIYSGYRRKALSRLKTSFHIAGRAVDFTFDGVPNTRIRDYFLKHHRDVGVGFYPNSFHVHLDVRAKKSFWIDYAGPNEPAIYAARPYLDVARGVAKRGYQPRRGSAQTREGAAKLRRRPGRRRVRRRRGGSRRQQPKARSRRRAARRKSVRI